MSSIISSSAQQDLDSTAGNLMECRITNDFRISSMPHHREYAVIDVSSIRGAYRHERSGFVCRFSTITTQSQMSACKSHGRIKNTNCGLTSSVVRGGAHPGGAGHGGHGGHGGGVRRGGEVGPVQVGQGSPEGPVFPAAPDPVFPAAPDPVFLVGLDPVDPVDPDLAFLACLGRPEVSREVLHHFLQACSNLVVAEFRTRLERARTRFTPQRQFKSAGA
jgi:hypothetical protein